MFNIIIFGPPGSGKGTQSKKLAEEFNLKHISTGDILRKEVEQQTELGKKAGVLMNRGELVPDEVVIGMIENKLEANKDANGFIFDGFPRTMVQAEALDKLLHDNEETVDVVISLLVSDGEITSRLLKRAEIEGRGDDNEATIQNRLNVYKQRTAPLMEYYRKQNKLEEVDGTGSVDVIFQRIVEIMKKYMS